MFGLGSKQGTAAKRAQEAKQRFGRIQAQHERAKEEAANAESELAEAERAAAAAIAQGSEQPRLEPQRRRVAAARSDVQVFERAVEEARQAVEVAEREERREKQAEGLDRYRKALGRLDKALSEAARASAEVSAEREALPFPNEAPALAWRELREAEGSRLSKWRENVQAFLHPPAPRDPVAEGCSVAIRITRPIKTSAPMGRPRLPHNVGEVAALDPATADRLVAAGAAEIVRDERPRSQRGKAHLKAPAPEPERPAVELF